MKFPVTAPTSSIGHARPHVSQTTRAPSRSGDGGCQGRWVPVDTIALPKKPAMSSNRVATRQGKERRTRSAPGSIFSAQSAANIACSHQGEHGTLSKRSPCCPWSHRATNAPGLAGSKRKPLNSAASTSACSVRRAALRIGTYQLSVLGTVAIHARARPWRLIQPPLRIRAHAGRCRGYLRCRSRARGADRTRRVLQMSCLRTRPTR